MPGEHCPACGAAQTGYGCGCLSDVADTAILPLTEGPPLVRPYVPEVAMSADQADDPYATALLPPLPPLPPRPVPPAGAPRELGLFPLAGEGEAAAPGRAAARRVPRRRARTLTVAGAGAGVVALGVGLAFAFSASPAPHQDTLEPLPSSVPDLSPLPSPTAAATSAAPVAAPSSAPATSAKPSPTRTRATVRPTPVAVTSTPPRPPSSAPPVTSAPPSPTDSPSPTGPPQTLSYGMRGAQVVTLQQQLAAASCGRHLNSGVYDNATEQAVVNLQQDNQLWQDPWGVYGPQTRDGLESGANCLPQ